MELGLENYPFSHTGSLVLHNRSASQTEISDLDIMVGSFAETRHFTTPHHSLGPLDTLQESLNAISSHTMGQAIRNSEHNRFAVDKYLPADAVARAPSTSRTCSHLKKFPSTSATPS